LLQLKQQVEAQKLEGNIPLRCVVFAHIIDNEDYNAFYAELRAQWIAQGFADIPVSLVAQSPYKQELTLEVYFCHLADNESITTKQLNQIIYRVKASADRKELYVSGLGYQLDLGNILKQSQLAFEQMKAILDAEGLGMNDIVRQWNYIEKITGFSTDGKIKNQHYQIFNDVRSLYYAQYQFENGYPAATGIGADWGGVVIDFVAVKGRAQILAVQNPEQIDAHHYKADVLEDNYLVKEEKKSTPKFERAKIVEFGCKSLVYISGTAAIKGQYTVSECNAVRQTQITIENIERLVSPENLIHHGLRKTIVNQQFISLRVYVKYAEDLLSVAQVMQENFAEVPCIILQSDVCRDNLLVEIEGVMQLEHE
jgi:enamine deaminase RidA (YjgF/YER057c/UK114 family)